MKIVDCFIWLAPHEKELLYLKFLLESPCVDEWVGVENHFTYRGDYKGPSLQQVVDGDPRFAPFRDRLTVISLEAPLCPPEEARRWQGVVDPPVFAEAEWRLRDAPLAHLLANYQDEDRVWVSDVDEMIDYSDPWRRDRLHEAFTRHAGEPLQFDRIRYGYDFHNRWFREKRDMITPAFTVGNLCRGEARLRDKKWVGRPVDIEDDRPLIFEYSFCFSYEGVLAKFDSSLHTHWTREKIDQSLRCNHWPMTSYQEVSRNCRWHWLEFVELTEKNSPTHVRENLDALRTHLVPDDYRENRLREYGYAPHFSPT